jgi:hypothetical protein
MLKTNAKQELNHLGEIHGPFAEERYLLGKISIAPSQPALRRIVWHAFGTVSRGRA